jgi:aromatic ring-opening dioxygenase catalytic subunit (LigB family)
MTKKATILYIPHGGGPLPLLDEATYGIMNSYLRGFNEGIKKPDAIVVVSAHWEASVVSITANPKPPMLFDYFGFPPETYQYEYPAAGEPELAGHVHKLLGNAGIQSHLDHDRGFDHGVYIPLMLMYPQADIPCIQISLTDSMDAAFHIRLGKALASLKQENLLILGSGYSFHNMAVFMSEANDASKLKNRQFEDWLAQTCSDTGLSETEREQRLADWALAPHARFCHPREEHLLPLQVCYGVGGSAAMTTFQEPVGGLITSAYQW